MTYAAPEWFSDAYCRDDPDWLDRDQDEQLDDCQCCPVRDQCLNYAAEVRATGIVMGGVVLPKTAPLRREAT